MTSVPPLACDMDAFTPEQRERYDELSAAIFTDDPAPEDRPDGYAFRFPADAGAFLRLAEWATLERLCCPFLSFALDLTPEGMALTLTGPEGTREFLREEFGLRRG